jgi:hypothetical protein
MKGSNDPNSSFSKFFDGQLFDQALTRREIPDVKRVFWV